MGCSAQRPPLGRGDEARRKIAAEIEELRLSAAYARGRAELKSLSAELRRAAFGLAQQFEAQADELESTLGDFPLT